jgi:signal transduction histidine kinase
MDLDPLSQTALAEPSAAQATPAPLPPPRGLGEEARRAFLRKVSHELRTPLNAIIGFADLLVQEPCGPMGAAEYAEYAAIIGVSGARMLKMVNQIVEIMRLECEVADLELRAEPLGALVDEVLQGLRIEARNLGVRIEVDGLDDMPWALADAKGVRTVLVNLLQNAMAHAPEGDAVMVRARRAGRQVAIEIEDRGPGADPAEAARLLRPFEKGARAGRASDGAGLGLPIALLLSRAMGGDLELRTAAGEGFTAIVTLAAA